MAENFDFEEQAAAFNFGDFWRAERDVWAGATAAEIRNLYLAGKRLRSAVQTKGQVKIRIGGKDIIVHKGDAADASQYTVRRLYACLAQEALDRYDKGVDLNIVNPLAERYGFSRGTEMYLACTVGSDFLACFRPVHAIVLGLFKMQWRENLKLQGSGMEGVVRQMIEGDNGTKIAVVEYCRSKEGRDAILTAWRRIKDVKPRDTGMIQQRVDEVLEALGLKEMGGAGASASSSKKFA
ncbi:nucleocapsid [Largemouth bass bunyavirus]|uniref:Nucleocapsid n=1 Tax=Largemouth bass bunyavirus TaxID=2594110 RepID=A0A514TTN1_9VIRU|nr:nucleocapsid [Largemouth bass bunyavirus]QDJ95877.1 nucleocapsid [Largemouth bass bunyavirus]